MCSSHWILLQSLPEHTSLSGRKELEPRWWAEQAGCLAGGCWCSDRNIWALWVTIKGSRLPRKGGRGDGRADETAQLSTLPSAGGGRDWRVRREATMAAHHWTIMLHFCHILGFLQEHSWLQSSSLPSPQAFSLQPTSVLSPGLFSKPCIPASAPLSTGGYPSQAGAHRVVAWTICVGLTLSCLPQTRYGPLFWASEAPCWSSWSPCW